MKRLILASASPRRLELLRQVGLDPLVVPSRAPEDFSPSEEPFAVAMKLAERKAKDVARAYPEDVVVGADTVVAIDGCILGKPKDEEEAAAMLKLLSGRFHDVFTGITVVTGRKVRLDFEKTTVKFRKLEPLEIERYAASGEGLDKAGGYGIQGKGALFVERLSGDYYNVMGLPLCRLYRYLKKELDLC